MYSRKVSLLLIAFGNNDSPHESYKRICFKSSHNVELHVSFNVNVIIYGNMSRKIATVFHGACDSYVSIFAFNLHLSVHFIYIILSLRLCPRCPIFLATVFSGMTGIHMLNNPLCN